MLFEDVFDFLERGFTDMPKSVPEFCPKCGRKLRVCRDVRKANPNTGEPLETKVYIGCSDGHPQYHYYERSK